MNQEEEDGVQDEYETDSEGKCGIIFLIDARLSMFTKDVVDNNNENESRFNIAIKCCRTVIMNKIICKHKDLIGVVLFRTDKGNPKIKNVTEFIELNYPSAEAVLQLDKVLNDKDSVDLQHTLGSSEDITLADTLWYCSSLFSNSGAKLEEKRILLFTDDDDPHSSNSDKAHMARKRAKDLNQSKISLELLPMGPDFLYSLFYKELVEIINGKDNVDHVEPASRLGELLERVNRLDYKSKRYAKIKLEIGKGVYVGISLYTFFREARVSSQEQLSKATNEPVTRVNQTFGQASGELLLRSDIEEFIHIAGKDIVFAEEEKVAMKKLMEPGITLLGFKPLSFLSEAKHCGQPCFAYPEESLVRGSQQIIKAMVERCVAKYKVAVCCITPRNRAITKYVCLVPLPGDEGLPLGFHIIPLPFYNDEREQTFETSPKVEKETIELVKKVIKKLKFVYKPSNFKNPKLQQFWAHLESLALGYDDPDTIEDDTEVPLEAQTERLGALSQEFNNEFQLTGVQSSKTKRQSRASPGPSKRVKHSSDDVNKQIIDAIPLKKVDKFTVVQLKDFLMSYKLNVKGMKKTDLVNLVYNLNV